MIGLALIPARGGSKGIPNKNIHPVGRVPLIVWSVAAALESPVIQRVIVSTDDAQIADIAQRCGAEVPFLRPAELAGDAAPDIGFVRHALDWLAREEGWRPDVVFHLRPTTPLRDPAHFAAALDALRAAPQATALRSAHALAESPDKMFRIDGGWFRTWRDGAEPGGLENAPRQSFPPAFLPNGYVDILLPDTPERYGTLHGPRILPYVTPSCIEVDGPEDIDRLELELAARGHGLLDACRARAAAIPNL